MCVFPCGRRVDAMSFDEKALVDKCDASIYKCDESLLKNAEDVMACLVESTWNESSPAPQHLGANATEFRNMTGYAGN